VSFPSLPSSLCRLPVSFTPNSKTLNPATMQPFDFHHEHRLIFGEESVERLGALASELGFRPERCWLLTEGPRPGYVENVG